MTYDYNDEAARHSSGAESHFPADYLVELLNGEWIFKGRACSCEADPMFPLIFLCLL